MLSQQIIRQTLETAELVAIAYLNDLSDAEFMQRPHPKCNHINWQVGHLILSENQQMNQISPGSMPELPDRFEEIYSAHSATSDDSQQFLSKDQLMAIYREQRQATMTVLSKISEEEMLKETGVAYAPSVAAMIQMQGAHWLMHCGQWVIVRRANEKAIVI